MGLFSFGFVSGDALGQGVLDLGRHEIVLSKLSVFEVRLCGDGFGSVSTGSLADVAMFSYFRVSISWGNANPLRVEVCVGLSECFGGFLPFVCFLFH